MTDPLALAATLLRQSLRRDMRGDLAWERDVTRVLNAAVDEQVRREASICRDPDCPMCGRGDDYGDWLKATGYIGETDPDRVHGGTHRALLTADTSRAKRVSAFRRGGERRSNRYEKRKAHRRHRAAERAWLARGEWERVFEVRPVTGWDIA